VLAGVCDLRRLALQLMSEHKLEPRIDKVEQGPVLKGKGDLGASAAGREFGREGERGASAQGIIAAGRSR